MINEKRIDIYKKTSYFTQSSFSSIQVYKNLISSRKLDLSNKLLFKVIEDVTAMLNCYSEIGGDIIKIVKINKKLESVLEGYKNSDYYLIRDILEYDILTNIDSIFEEIKADIYRDIS